MWDKDLYTYTTPVAEPESLHCQRTIFNVKIVHAWEGSAVTVTPQG